MKSGVNLETRDARKKLKPRARPYYRRIGKGIHLGYRKGKRERQWVVRRSTGDVKSPYTVTTMAGADDLEIGHADGVRILDYWQAVELAKGKAKEEPTARR